jgi:NitT/TauT family transport system substrate-binding protein
LFIAEDWSNLVAFMVAEKMLAVPVPLDRIYSNEMVDAINDYDRSAIIAAAKAFNPTDLK